MTYHEYLKYKMGSNAQTEELVRLIKVNMADLIQVLANEGTLDAFETLRAAANNQPEEMTEALSRVMAYAIEAVDIFDEGASQPAMEKMGESIAQLMLHNIKLFEEISGLKEGE